MSFQWDKVDAPGFLPSRGPSDTVQLFFKFCDYVEGTGIAAIAAS
jgi:hypothetical protein